MEKKGDEKGSKSDTTNLFGANTPSVSCTFERKYNVIKGLLLPKKTDILNFKNEMYSTLFPLCVF